MSLSPYHDAAGWPKALPAQTTLQKHIHRPHQARRTAIVDALCNTHFAEERKLAERMASCSNTVLIAHQASTHSVRPWLPRCGARLCPFCGKGRAARVADQLHGHLTGMKHPRHLVLTYASRSDPLGKQLNDMRAAFTNLRKTNDWKRRVTAGVYTIEITRNNETGLWHPHLHCILDGEYFPVKLLARLWNELMPGGENVWITEVKQTRNAAWELAKYVGKPPPAEAWPKSAIQAYSRAVAGTRMLQTFGTLHGKKLPEPDEPPAEKPEAVLIALPRVAYLAAQGVDVAQDLAALLWSRWPMLRTYLEEVCPDACLADILTTNPGLRCPRPPPMGNGRYAPHTKLADLEALDLALDLTLLLWEGLEALGDFLTTPVEIPI